MYDNKTLPISVALGICAAAFAVAPAVAMEGPHSWIGNYPEQSCAVCHRFTMQYQLDASTQICLNCHSDTPTWVPATSRCTHGSQETGSTRFEYDLECTDCHEPHGDHRIPAGASRNAKYIRNVLEDLPIDNGVWLPLELTVIDHTQSPSATVVKTLNNEIVFTGLQATSWDFADGVPGEAGETDICEACHTLTDHHRRDATLPVGSQSHFDGEQCVGCHAHDAGFAPSGGEPLTGPHAAATNQDCTICHDAPEFGTPDLCLGCHSVDTAHVHATSVTGSTRFDYSIDCRDCHDPHGWDSKLNNVDGTRNIKYVKARIEEQITVIDQSVSPAQTVVKQIAHDVVFDSRPDDFADGDASYDRDICATCHTLTAHHQNDGTAPGGQSHYDGQDCTSCHSHVAGFAPAGGATLEGPHAAIPGFPAGDCNVCHGLAPGGFTNALVDPDSICAACHGDTPSIVAATGAHVHSAAASGTSKYDYATNCTHCHDPHSQVQAGGAYVRGSIEEIVVDPVLGTIAVPLELTVEDRTQSPPVTVVKQVQAPIVYGGPGDLGTGGAGDLCAVCHSFTEHHQNDGAAPGGQSHYDGQDCTACHSHLDSFTFDGAVFGLEGPHATMPGYAADDCDVCHDQAAGGFTGALAQANVVCLSCHGAAPGTLDATDAHTHATSVTGSARFTYSTDCTGCHDPHRSPQPGGMYVRAVIEDLVPDPILGPTAVPLALTVTDQTQTPPVVVVKQVQAPLLYEGPWSLGDGSGGDLCESCHTLTDHHQSDGSAPGGQSHYDGQDCTQCHVHVDGFAFDGAAFGLQGPHAAIPGFPQDDCAVCHDLVAGGIAGALQDPDPICLACHGDTPTVIDASDAHAHASSVTGTTKFDYVTECTHCHSPHRQDQPGGNYVRSAVEDVVLDPLQGSVTVPIQLTVTDKTQSPPVTFDKQVLNDILYNDVTSMADGGNDDLCESCHSLTDHHQSDGTAPGGQSHYDGSDCSACHDHLDGFQPLFVDVANHPQATTDCAGCHLSRSTGQPDLLGLHGNDCGNCHVTGLDGTLLGPVGSFGGECSECHNTNVVETGSMDVPTRGHRCVACHGQQLATSNITSVHNNHIERANCVVCHGFIPDTGTQIGSGDREICKVCHTQRTGSIRSIHEKHVDKTRGLSCLECHGGQRPAVDVVPGPPVGGSDIVCEICHSHESGSPQEIHEQHTKDAMDCGACHADANLQDDRIPMEPIDDPRRAQVDRALRNECNNCHSTTSGSNTYVHDKHVPEQSQWCFNCHEPGDGRPLGTTGFATEPAESCGICHGSGHSYNDAQPFAIHHTHSGNKPVKCYACHQGQPELLRWPNEWLGGVEPPPGSGGIGTPGPAGRLTDGSLILDRDLGRRIALSWGPSCAADVDFEVYEGILGDFTSHLPKLCSTAGSTAVTLTPAAGSSYFLVVPRSLDREGSYGTVGDASERPSSTAACLVQEVATCP